MYWQNWPGPAPVTQPYCTCAETPWSRG